MTAAKFNIHDLATAKGFTPGQLTKFGVRNGQGGVVIPYYEPNGDEYIKYQIRTAATGKNNFRWSPGEATLIPYGLHRPIKYDKQFVWIVEGASDCWTMWVNNLPALGIPGATSAGSCLKLAHVEDCTTVAVIEEHDEAGERFPHRVAQALHDQGFAGEVCSVRLPYKDARESATHCASHEEFRKMLAAAFRKRVVVERVTMALPNMNVLNVRLLSTVTPEPVKWLWNCRIPERNSSVLAGDGGEGKSFASNGLAAAFTTGASLPGGSITEPCDVLMWNAEDTAENTIYQRAERSGAALHRIHILDDVTETGIRVPFGLRHIHKLDEYLEGHPNIRFVILDPITALLANVDGHTDTEVRSALQPFVEVARNRNISVLIIMHLKKSESTRVLHRLSGSVAFGALGRSVMYLGTHAITGRKAIDTIKHNLAPSKPLPVEFSITEEDGIVWGDLTAELDAETIEASYIAAKRGVRPASAIDFIRRTLASGPKVSEIIFADATERGISSQVLRAAKESLGIESYKCGVGVGSRWFWKMPDDDRPEVGIERHLSAVPSQPKTADIHTTSGMQQAISHLFPSNEDLKSEPEIESQGSLFTS